jgi:signal transduction histidine kinase/DNA-binding response OmpR family regulator
MKKMIHFFETIFKGFYRPSLISFIILFVLFGGILLNYAVETKINRSVQQHNKRNLFAIELEQYKQAIDKTTSSLSQIDNELNHYLITEQEEKLILLKTSMSNLQNHLLFVKEQSNKYVPKYLVNIFVHKIRNRVDFQKEVLSVFSMSGKNAALKLLNSEADKKTISEYTTSEIDLASALNRQITSFNGQLMADENETSAMDKKWNLISLLFMLLIALVVMYQTTRNNMLNKELNIAVQKMQDATRLKDQFLSNITHELRTPLNSILGYTNLLLKRNHQPETEKWIQAVNSSGTLLLDIVNDVLDYSKLESGYLHFTKEPFELDEVLNNLKNIMGNRAEAKGISLVVLKDQSLPTAFSGDEKKLKQVLINLAGNALKFTEKGTVKIEIVLQKKIEEQYWLEFTVSDTGIGIEEQNLKHIFHRFYQVENSYSRKYSGTGLGLPIVKQLVDLQGGTITVNSMPGTGTIFKFVLPFEKATHVEKEEVNMAPVRTMLQTAAKRILVVDDHELNRELLELILKEYNCRVVTAENGKEALSILERMKVDLVLMDVQMPELNGMETTQQIREQLVLDVPVIACTAFSQPSEKQMCFEAGMNDYLGKPIKEHDLLKLLNKYLQVSTDTKVKTPLVNYSKIQSIVGTNRQLTVNMLSRVVTLVPEELERLHQSILQRNYHQTKELAHNMCSTIGLMGAPATLMEQVKSIQYTAKEPKPDHEQLLHLFYMVNDTVHKIMDELKEYLAA